MSQQQKQNGSNQVESKVEVPVVKTEEHATPISEAKASKKPDERKMSLQDQILAVLGSTEAEGLTNSQIRKRLLMRSSISKKGEEDKKYQALHSTMMRLTAKGLVKCKEKGKGNANLYWLAPSQE